MKLRVLIADDEPLARERLRQLLAAETETELVAECGTGQEALRAIQHSQPDLVFLDIRMPDMDGFGVLEQLSAGPLPDFIFVTAHDRFAIRAFDVHAVDYLLKPFDRQRFQTALHRARERRSRQGANAGPGRVREMLESIVPPRKPIERLTIRSQGRICIINPLEIDWISAADNYAELHVASATHLLRTTLSSLLAQLPADRFVRISRSHVVNVDRIKELRSKSHGDYLVLLQDGKRLTGSRTFRQNLMPLLGSSH